jgi:hypothetical protein
MYGLPKDIDLGPLVGVTLQQVCVGQYDTILNFSDDVSIGSASTFVCTSPGSKSQTFTSPPSAAPSLVRLLGLSVVRARRDPPGTLVLEFEHGERLELPDAQENYESYTLHIGGKLYVI